MQKKDVKSFSNNRAKFKVSSIEKPLKYKFNYFDAVIVAGVFQYSTKPEFVFNEIYSSNLGKYNLCCHAVNGHISAKFKTEEISPFKFFFSKEMDEIREKMLNGETDRKSVV